MISANEYVTIPWRLGPEALHCQVEVEIDPPERATWDYPGSPASAWMTGEVRVRGNDGYWRKPTPEEWEWLEEEGEDIENRALGL